MKQAQRKLINRQCVEIVKNYGGELNSRGDQYEIITPIGRAFVTVDVLDNSKVQSLYVRFEDAKKAKPLFGHWKVNLNQHEREDFSMCVELHLSEIFNRMDRTTIGRIIASAVEIARTEPDYNESERLGLCDALTVLLGVTMDLPSDEIYDALKERLKD